MIAQSPRNFLTMTVILLAIAAPGVVDATVALRNVPPSPHGAPDGTPLAVIAEAIKLAASDREWKVREQAPGLMTASLYVRNRHRSVVRIGYDELNYWIEYLDSENLDYSEKDIRLPGKRERWAKGPRIHASYNRWVQSLCKAIELSAKHPPEVSPAVELGDPLVLIADELEKLDALRGRGVLTDDEFQQQKRKLLAR